MMFIIAHHIHLEVIDNLQSFIQLLILWQHRLQAILIFIDYPSDTFPFPTWR